ncbi:SbtR family transcriptional regulator [Actinomadura rupiterrae]|uniref:SbtR family transcriptional regulator n=1 Tax=Actinomadura rupiterrae TaxID=559627 RepID=UPI0020A572AA|nr:hypothetical protein [Actinomadura rupiterrae]MCP2334794.1 hypothetical protein [Actinomadura rupiterrae]
MDSVRMLEGKVERLLVRAQEAGAVRSDVRVDEVLVLLASTSQAALHPGWSPDLQRRTLVTVFRGLSP